MRDCKEETRDKVETDAQMGRELYTFLVYSKASAIAMLMTL